MKGGVGRYAQNLVKALRSKDNEVIVACDESNTQTDSIDIFPIIRRGDYGNSERIRKLATEKHVDIIHVQYERSLYEIEYADPISFLKLNKSTLYDLFATNNVPKLLTSHSTFSPDEFKEYFDSMIHTDKGRIGRLPSPLRAMIRREKLKRMYSAFYEIIAIANEVISITGTARKSIGKGDVIYLGAEPNFTSNINKLEFRRQFGLPEDKRLILGFGHAAYTKGFDLLDQIELPRGWQLVVKQTNRGHSHEIPTDVKNAINLNVGYLDEEAMSKLFFSCDAIILPRSFSTGSGVLVDGFAHGLPFVSTDLAMFREFAELGLGIVAKRDPEAFSEAIRNLALKYDQIKKNVEDFKSKLLWKNVASRHIEVYARMLAGSEGKR